MNRTLKNIGIVTLASSMTFLGCSGRSPTAPTEPSELQYVAQSLQTPFGTFCVAVAQHENAPAASQLQQELVDGIDFAVSFLTSNAPSWNTTNLGVGGCGNNYGSRTTIQITDPSFVRKYGDFNSNGGGYISLPWDNVRDSIAHQLSHVGAYRAGMHHRNVDCFLYQDHTGGYDARCNKPAAVVSVFPAPTRQSCGTSDLTP